MNGWQYIVAIIFMLCWIFAGKRNIAPWYTWAGIGLVTWWVPYGLFELIGEGVGMIGGILAQITAGIIVLRKSYTKEHKTALHAFTRIEERTKRIAKPSNEQSSTDS